MSELESGLGEPESKPLNEVQSESELIAQPMHDEPAEQEVIEPVENFSQYSKAELLTIIDGFAHEDINQVKQKVFAVKDAYEHLINSERDNALAAFIEQGGTKEDFKFTNDPADEKFFSALRKFNKRKAEHFEQVEKQRNQNLKIKQDILTELKNLIQNEENMQRAFEQFHDMQARWRSTGAVPGNKVNDLWMTYKVFTDKFYELIKINRDLQELDQRKNLEAKIQLCEKAEELILQPSLNKALGALQTLQNQWRETGPVGREKKNEVWERFKSASDKVYERRREFFDDLNKKQAANLEAKNSLLTKIDELVKQEVTKAAEWMEKSKAVIDIQNEWKKIGYADKKSNDEVWAKFKGICDDFFKRKNDFFQTLKKEYAANLQMKTELCMQAETLRDSSDWRKASEELKRLQQDWKNIGPVGDKYHYKIWDRFRAACDGFFKRKSEHYNSIEGEQTDNLAKKNLLADEVEQFVASENPSETIEQLKNFQRRWSEIGLVPFEKKDEVQKKFKAAIDKHFKSVDNLNRDRSYNPSRTYHTGKPGNQTNDIKYRMNLLNTEVNTLENNLGFFAKSKNADAMKKEFEEKINKAKEEIKKLKQQLNEVNKPAEKTEK